MKKFVEDHFDKLLLAGLLVYLIHVVILLAYFGMSPETIAWARELTAAVSGALLGLITGVKAGQAMEKRRADAAASADNENHKV